MSGKVRRVDYFPDEYIGGIGGVLRADEQGVYWMVCSLIMSGGDDVTYDAVRLAGLCRIRPADIRKIVDRLLSIGKLTLTHEGKLSQKRARSEVEKSANRIQIAAEKGAKGGRPSKKDEQKQPDDKAAGLSGENLTTNQQPATSKVSEEETSIERPKPAKRRHSYSEKFSEFWDAYPTDALMSKAITGKAFEVMSPEDQDAAIGSIPAFKAYCSQHPDYRPVHAVRYLTQRRFEGFNTVAKKVDSRAFVQMGSREWEAIRVKRNVLTLQHSEHRGERGWWFDKSEIEAAMRLQRGATH